MNSPTPPPNYSSRPMQYRLMALVGMLMAVILLMFEAAKPKNWEWMWKFERQAAAATGVDSAPIAQSETTKSIDTRLVEPTVGSSHPPDSFRSEVSTDAEFGPTASTVDEITPESFDDVEDDTYFRSEESAAWFSLLNVLRTTPIQELEDNSIGDVAFVQLFHQTADFRGKLVTINGTLRRAHQVPAPKNDLGIETYWQCWIRPHDGSNSPIVVYSLDMPEQFQEGMDVRQSASITGFCFKRWAYSSASGPRIAPILLAKNATLHDDSVSFDRRKASPGWRNLILGFAVVIGLAAAGLAIWASQWKRKRSEDDEHQSVADLAAEIGNEQLPTVGDKLRELESGGATPQRPN